MPWTGTGGPVTTGHGSPGGGGGRGTAECVNACPSARATTGLRQRLLLEWLAAGQSFSSLSFFMLNEAKRNDGRWQRSSTRAGRQARHSYTYLRDSRTPSDPRNWPRAAGWVARMSGSISPVIHSSRASSKAVSVLSQRFFLQFLAAIKRAIMWARERPVWTLTSNPMKRWSFEKCADSPR